MNNRRPLATFAVLGGIIILLIIIGSNRFGTLGGFTRAVAKPFAGFMHRAGEMLAFSKEQATSEEAMVALRSENARLAAENALLLTLEDENRRLRDYLVFAEAQKSSLQMAEIIARGVPGDSWQNRQTVTLNQGSDQGIAVGMPIVSSEGVLVGKITAVKNNIAEACLMYSADCRIAVTVAGRGDTLGIARGDLGLSVLIELIPQTQTVNERDVIVSSGLEAGMPPGLLLGYVSRVIKEGNELWQQAIVEPAADVETLRFVAVLKQ
mgnify:FL=1|jgi:rod shape-determining protein MreC